jgi:hypothetical protein
MAPDTTDLDLVEPLTPRRRLRREAVWKAMTASQSLEFAPPKELRLDRLFTKNWIRVSRKEICS